MRVFDNATTQTLSTAGRGSLASAAWFREQLEAIGETQGSFARLMLKLGDDRSHAVILRSVGQMAGGQLGVSGEMRVLLNYIRRQQEDACAARDFGAIYEKRHAV